MTPTDWQAADVHANGLRFHYTRTGGADDPKPPLVLAHGFSDDGLCWTPVARELESHYDLILVDARNHGRSDAPDQPFDLLDLTEDLAGVITELHLARPMILGHSLGAITALLLAAKYPGLARAVLLEDPPPWWAADALPAFTADWRVQTHAWVDKLKGQTRETMIAAKHLESPAWSEAELGPWADSKLRVHPYAIDRAEPDSVDLPLLLTHVIDPVLLITADHALQAAVTPQQAAALQTLLPQTRVVHIPGAGHNIRREQFGSYMAAVKNFLAEVG